MSNTKPQPRNCSMCSQELRPQLTATSIDGNFNTIEHYSFGHICPEQSKRYDDRMSEINNSCMSEEQKNNAINAAAYMNAWGS